MVVVVATDSEGGADVGGEAGGDAHVHGVRLYPVGDADGDTWPGHVELTRGNHGVVGVAERYGVRARVRHHAARNT